LVDEVGLVLVVVLDGIGLLLLFYCLLVGEAIDDTHTEGCVTSDLEDV